MRQAAATLVLVLLLTGCATLEEFGEGLGDAFERLAAPVTLAPQSPFAEAMRDPEHCQEILRQQGVEFIPARDQTDGAFCVVTNALLLGQQPLRTSPQRTMMHCPLAAGVLLWTRHSVEPAAREMLGTDLRQIDHYGVYACRRVYGQAEGRPSAHARAAALDVAAFRLADGRTISVERDWPAAGAEGAFLRRVRDDACKVFGSVLSPDYNAAHHNHLHLEHGGRGPCS